MGVFQSRASLTFGLLREFNPEFATSKEHISNSIQTSFQRLFLNLVDFNPDFSFHSNEQNTSYSWKRIEAFLEADKQVAKN